MGRQIAATLIAAAPAVKNKALQSYVNQVGSWVAQQSERDLRVYLIENVIHALLCQMSVARDHVVRMLFPLRVRNLGHPRYTVACVMEDPGMGDLLHYLARRDVTDRACFSIVTQVAWALQQMQDAISFQHRDLKTDNIMMSETRESSLQVTTEDASFLVPTCGVRPLFIDFGMTRMRLGEEYVGCDCNSKARTFNPCHDIQFLFCTMLEDRHHLLPSKFLAWLRNYTEPIMRRVRARRVSTRARTTEDRDLCMMHTTHYEQMTRYTPQAVLTVMQKHWTR